MKTARQLVVNPAVCHVFKGGDDKTTKRLVFCRDSLRGNSRRLSGRLVLATTRISLDEEIQRRGVRKFRRLPKPAVLRIEHPEC
jgi:hypothetical protein